MFQVADRLGIHVDGGMLHMILALEMAYMGIRGPGDKPPACRHPDACAMCRKRCSERSK